MLESLPKADRLLADRGCDADWLRDALADKDIKPCIPGRKSRDTAVKHDRRRYKRRHRIEMMVGRLKRLAPRAYPLRPPPNRLPLGDRLGRNRPVLARRPEPREGTHMDL